MAVVGFTHDRLIVSFTNQALNRLALVEGGESVAQALQGRAQGVVGGAKACPHRVPATLWALDHLQNPDRFRTLLTGEIQVPLLEPLLKPAVVGLAFPFGRRVDLEDEILQKHQHTPMHLPPLVAIRNWKPIVQIGRSG